MDDYPKTLSEMERRFATNEDCQSYLISLRWPDGYLCPRCNHREAWEQSSGLFRCKSCDFKCSVTSGTIFEGTRKPLVSWFRAIWWVTSQKNGASAKNIQRVLGFKSYQTAWVWLHKLRRAMVRPGREKLTGVIEVDETVVGGEKPGKRGRGAEGKTLVGIAVEDKGDEGIGRIRLGILANASADSLTGFATERISRGSTVRTDNWLGYNRLESEGYYRCVVDKNKLKLAHLVASLLKRWLLGTHQGAVSHEHLAYYLDEYTFRFNRRTSTHRGKLFMRLLENAIAIEPVTYKKMIKHARGRKSADHKM